MMCDSSGKFDAEGYLRLLQEAGIEKKKRRCSRKRDQESVLRHLQRPCAERLHLVGPTQLWYMKDVNVVKSILQLTLSIRYTTFYCKI